MAGPEVQAPRAASMSTELQQVNGQIEALLYSLGQEGLLDDQFAQLMQLQVRRLLLRLLRRPLPHHTQSSSGRCCAGRVQPRLCGGGGRAVL